MTINDVAIVAELDKLRRRAVQAERERDNALARADRHLADMNGLEKLWMERRDAALARAEEAERKTEIHAKLIEEAFAERNQAKARAEEAERRFRSMGTSYGSAWKRVAQAEAQLAELQGDYKQQREAYVRLREQTVDPVRAKLTEKVAELEAQLAEAREDSISRGRDCFHYREALEQIAASDASLAVTLRNEARAALDHVGGLMSRPPYRDAAPEEEELHRPPPCPTCGGKGTLSTGRNMRPCPACSDPERQEFYGDPDQPEIPRTTPEERVALDMEENFPGTPEAKEARQRANLAARMRPTFGPLQERE